MLVLSETDVRAVLPMADLIPAMRSALIEYSSGRVQQPLRTVLEIGAARAFFGLMPAFIPTSGALGTKLVTVFGSNAAKGLPSHLATVVLLDEETGGVKALLDGRYITEARTAAVSAVSVQALARPESSVLALIGSGVQAKSHLEAIALIAPLREVRVWSPTPAHRDCFVQASQALTRVSVAPADSAERAVAGADIVVLVSSAREPIVRSEWIGNGTHICAVGACRPDQREMDTALVRRARLYVDSRVGALAEAGDVVLPLRENAIDERHIVGELGEVLSGRAPGRASADEVTCFKSLGMAVEDVAAAQLACQGAAARGLGRDVVLS